MAAQATTPTPEEYAFARLSVFHATMFEEETPAKHHRAICRYLEALDTGYLKGEKFRNPDGGRFNRFMCFGPPGMAKTRYVSHSFPAWYLGRNYKKRVLACSHTSEYAEDNGGTVRDIVAREDYNAVFGVHILAGSSAKWRWSVNGPSSPDGGNRGQYIGAGVGKAITGRRFDLGIIDDAIKDSEVADSFDARSKIWKWYLTSFRTRKKPNAAIVIINTRWHDDDLCGRILPEGWEPRTGWAKARDGEWWFVLNIPALAEANDPLGRKPGEGLWIDYFGQAHWEQERRSQTPRDWSALYQQRPTPESGAFFNRDWVKYYGNLALAQASKPLPPRSRMKFYMTSDYATEDDRGDYTVHMGWGVDENDDVYALDMWRGQKSSDVWIEAGIDMAQIYEPMFWFQPKDLIGKSIGPLLRKRMQERKCYVALYEISEAGIKEIKARAFQGRTSMGKVFLPCPLSYPATEEWTAKMIGEMLRFPAGEHDDMVDNGSILFRGLDVIVRGRVPERAPGPVTINTAPPTYGELQKKHFEKRQRSRENA